MSSGRPPCCCRWTGYDDRFPYETQTRRDRSAQHLAKVAQRPGPGEAAAGLASTREKATGDGSVVVAIPGFEPTSLSHDVQARPPCAPDPLISALHPDLFPQDRICDLGERRTVGDHSKPLGSHGMGTKRGPSRRYCG
jgi:hypothetical protein